jgi:ribosomal protein L7/L12
MTVPVFKGMIETCYKQSSKLKAVEFFKKATGLGVKESKEHIDNLWHDVDELYNNISVQERRHIKKVKVSVEYYVAIID